MKSYKMKLIWMMLILGILSQTDEDLTQRRRLEEIRTNKIVDFLKGLMNGFDIEEDMGQMMTCINKTNYWWDEMKTSFSEMKDMHYLWAHFSSTMQNLLSQVLSLSIELRPCIVSGSFLYTIFDLLTNLSPTSLFTQTAKALIIKNTKLMKNVKGMYYSIKSYDSYAFGHHLAQLLSVLLITDPTITNNIILWVQNSFGKLMSTQMLENTLGMVKHSDLIQFIVKKAYNGYNSFNSSSIFRAISSAKNKISYYIPIFSTNNNTNTILVTEQLCCIFIILW